MSLLRELQRRNVIRVAAAYLVAAWLIVQVVETILPVFEFPVGWIRLVIIILAIGFVPVVILAWVFQLTPDGLKLDRDADAALPASRRAQKMLDRAIIVILSLGLVYFAFDKFVVAPDRAAEREAEAAAWMGRNDLVFEALERRSATGYWKERLLSPVFQKLRNDPRWDTYLASVGQAAARLDAIEFNPVMPE